VREIHHFRAGDGVHMKSSFFYRQVYTYIYVHIYILEVYIYVYIYVCIYIYVYMNIYLYMYIYIYIEKEVEGSSGSENFHISDTSIESLHKAVQMSIIEIPNVRLSYNGRLGESLVIIARLFCYICIFYYLYVDCFYLCLIDWSALIVR
jgi:hypothetical protein